MRRTSGEERIFSPSLGVAGELAPGCCSPGVRGPAGIGGCEVPWLEWPSPVGVEGVEPDAPPGWVDPGSIAFSGVLSPVFPVSPSISATTAFTSTVSFSFTRILVSTPEVGEGISASTLSVEISKSGSSRSTRSPTFFSHLTTVPSATLSPIWGMMTLVGMKTSSVKLTVPWR